MRRTIEEVQDRILGQFSRDLRQIKIYQKPKPKNEFDEIYINRRKNETTRELMQNFLFASPAEKLAIMKALKY